VGNQNVNGKQVVWNKGAQQTQQNQTTANALRQTLVHHTGSFHATDVIFNALGLNQFKVSPQEEQNAKALAQNFITSRAAAGNITFSDSAVALKVVLADRLGGDKASAGGIVNSLGDKALKEIKDALGNKTKNSEISDADASRLLEIADLYKTDDPNGQMKAVYGKPEYAMIFAGTYYAIGNAGKEYASTIASLSHDELCALHIYTKATHCKDINYNLRNGITLGKASQTAVDLAKQAMDKLPDFTGPCYRGTKLPVKLDATLVTKGTYRDYAFTSSSANPDKCFPGTHQFTIFSKTGKDVSFVSQYPEEKEVLFRPGTKFDILARKGDASKIYQPGAGPDDMPLKTGEMTGTDHSNQTSGWGECRVNLEEANPVKVLPQAVYKQ
jgi:hypothetical protein